MKKRIKGIACLLLACLILVASGCVKTPEGEAVAAKTKIDGMHVGEVKSEDGTPTPQDPGQPEHIKESWTQALGDPDFGGAGTHAVYLYDDHFTLIVNASNTPQREKDIPLDDIESGAARTAV